MEPTGKRKLAAILMADAVGYSRLMGQDEAATVASIKASREIFREQIAGRSGRVVNAPGDSILAEFDSVVDALAAAVEIQRALAERNEALSAGEGMQFRIGINLGDVVSEQDAVYGDGVNIAARLEALAEPGGVCISRGAYDQAKGKLPLEYEYLGEHDVKNIAEPVRVYRVLSVPGAAAQRVIAAHRSALRSWRVAALICGAAVLTAALAAGGAWYLAGRPTEDPALAMPTGPTVAVLPFTNMSGDPGQDYFSDGITEEIITELTRFRTLRVLARNSTFQYKGNPVDVREVGEALGANYVLEGSVRRAGPTVRVTAQLLDARDGRHLWAESYEREVSHANLLRVQDDITRQVVATIGDIYGAIQRARLSDTASANIGSAAGYECVLRAYEFVREYLHSAERHLQIRTCLERAVEETPHYADAWAWLASSYREEYWAGFNSLPGDPLERAEAAARKAIALDGQNQQGNLVLAQVLFFKRDLDAFFVQAERTLAINPNSNDLLGAVGLFIAYAGDWERGIALVRKAISLSPSNYPGWYHTVLAWHHYRKHEYRKSLDEAVRIGIPGFYITHLALAANYGQLGETAKAANAVKTLLEVYPEYPQRARRNAQIWFTPEFTEHLFEGLRMAGLDIPDAE